VEELFEARTPKTLAVLTEIGGKASVRRKKDVVEITVKSDEFGSTEYVLYADYQSSVRVGDTVTVKQVLARSKVDRNVVRATVAGVIESIGTKTIVVRHAEKSEKTYKVPVAIPLVVQDGREVAAGQPLTIGHLDLKALMQVRGIEAVQEYIMNEVQHIYASQGQTINDKHVEIIVKQMFSKVRVLDPGQSPFLPGEIVNSVRFERTNEELRSEDKREAYGEQLLLGITKIALYTDSWLSAASFQETIRVLVEASVTKRIDHLKGLKENVIIGRLIPAAAIYRQKTPSRHAS
jgi:DNA-directed RNA polymerase subunit beta'